MLEKLARFHARVFVMWTSHPDLLTLRNPHSTTLSEPYRQLLLDMRGLIQHEAPDTLGALNFDLRGAHEGEQTERPELRPYVGRMIGLRYEFPRGGPSGRISRTIRRVR